MTTTMTTVLDLVPLDGPVRPLRPAPPATDLEGAPSPLACREPASRDTAPDVILGGTAGPPMIGALRAKLAGTGSHAAAARATAGATAAAAAPPATESDADSTVSVLLAAAIARAVGSFRSATGAVSRRAASPSAPRAGTAAPAAPPTAAPAATSASRGPAATVLTPLEQAVHDLVEQGSREQDSSEQGSRDQGSREPAWAASRAGELE
jgi:hypothetical protein